MSVSVEEEGLYYYYCYQCLEQRRTSIESLTVSCCECGVLCVVENFPAKDERK